MSQHVGTQSDPDDTFVPEFDPEPKALKIRTNFQAQAIIEDDKFIKRRPDELVAAYQCLIDSGLIWKLSDWQIRDAHDLIENEECFLPEGDEHVLD